MRMSTFSPSFGVTSMSTPFITQVKHLMEFKTRSSIVNRKIAVLLGICNLRLDWGKRWEGSGSGSEKRLLCCVEGEIRTHRRFSRNKDEVIGENKMRCLTVQV